MAEPLDPVARRAVIAVFLVVVVAYPFQYAFVRHFGEPYPALTMPTFASAPRAGEPIGLWHVDIVVRFAAGEPAVLSPLEVFAELPYHIVFPLTEAVLGVDVGDHPGNVRRGAGLGERLLPGLRHRRALEARGGIAPATRSWLGARVRTLFPARAPVSVTVRWFHDVIALDADPILRTRTLAHEYELELS